MPTRMLLACLLVVTASLVAAAPAAAVSPRTSMVREINEYRAAHGLRPLRVSERLHSAADRYSERMMSRGFFAHSGVRAGKRFSAVGEVLEIHRGHSPAVGRALRSWKRSGGHAAILLSSHYKLIGVGYSRGRFHGRRAGVWTVQVGRR